MHSNWRDCTEWEKQGLKLSTTSNEACKLFDATLSQYVGWYDDPSLGGLEASCKKLIEADPNFVMGKALVYGLELLGTGRTTRLDSSFRNDIDNLVNLSQSTSSITERECLHVQAIKLWSSGLLPEATQIWESILMEYPEDILALKMGHDTYFYLGRPIECRDSVARVLSRWKKTTPLYSYLHGIYAFGLEECNMYTEAERHALIGLELNKRDAWSTHSLAHVFEMTGAQDKGIKFMSDTEDQWSSCAMLACHNYWHLALYHLDKGDYEAALTIYDSHVEERFQAGTLLDFVDATSLLYRLELEGVNVGDRWKAPMKMCKEHVEDHVLVFNDVHMMMAALGNDDHSLADKLLTSTRKFIESCPDHYMSKVAKNIGYDICQAVQAYDAGNYAEAVSLLHPIRYKIIEMGGSHAQRDICNQLLINAALKSPLDKHQKLARFLLVERKELKKNSALTDRLIARAMACHTN